MTVAYHRMISLSRQQFPFFADFIQHFIHLLFHANLKRMIMTSS